MSLRVRMILLISLLLAGSVLATTAILTANARARLLAGEQISGDLVALELVKYGALASMVTSRWNWRVSQTFRSRCTQA